MHSYCLHQSYEYIAYKRIVCLKENTQQSIQTGITKLLKNENRQMIWLNLLFFITCIICKLQVTGI